MMEKRRYQKKNRNHLYDQKEKEKELMHLNFLSPSKDYMSLTLFLIINFFKT